MNPLWDGYAVGQMWRERQEGRPSDIPMKHIPPHPSAFLMGYLFGAINAHHWQQQQQEAGEANAC